MPEARPIRPVNIADLPWRPSTVASGVLVPVQRKARAGLAAHELHLPAVRDRDVLHEHPEFLFVLEGELVQAGRRMGPGWASVAGAGTIDEDVHSETGCVFVLVDRA
jgi:hypothetical protein